MNSNSLGTLYLVSTPIGNKDDITKRAIDILKQTSHLYCEETKPGYRLITQYGIRKELTPINEHNETEKLNEIWELLKRGNNIAYFSDCGTPVIADPGFKLVQFIRSKKGKIIPIPGVSSITAALTLSPFQIDRFLYFGFISNKKELRKKHLSEIAACPYTMVLLETPYRLKRLIEELLITLGQKKKICLCLNLTTNQEKFIVGFAREIVKKKDLPKKGEFVVLISPPL